MLCNKIVTYALRRSQKALQSQFLLSTITKSTNDFDLTKIQKFLESLREEFYYLRNSGANNPNQLARMRQLEGIVTALEQKLVLESNMVNTADIANEKDNDMRELMEEENQVYSKLLQKSEQEILNQLLHLADNDYYPSVIFEITAGAGGQEAMLFAEELLYMYCRFFDYNEWDYEIIEKDVTDIGGIRHANLQVHDPQAFNNLCYEAGVHRVQRVPATEKSGRIHTSTASVTVIPKPSDINVTIAEKDLKIETKRASGAGGQHVNTTDSAVRIVHIPSGIAIECQTERSQIKNREIAMKRLHMKLLQQKIESSDSKTKATRRAQQGHLNRNEKIRTYNFVQDRITDHRIQQGTVHNLEEFFKGGAHLESLIQKVVVDFRKAKVSDIIQNWLLESTKTQQKKITKQ